MCAGPLINVHLESGGNYWLIYEVVARFSVGAGVHPRGISLPVLLEPHACGFWRKVYWCCPGFHCDHPGNQTDASRSTVCLVSLYSLLHDFCALAQVRHHVLDSSLLHCTLHPLIHFLPLTFIAPPAASSHCRSQCCFWRPPDLIRESLNHSSITESYFWRILHCRTCVNPHSQKWCPTVSETLCAHSSKNQFIVTMKLFLSSAQLLWSHTVCGAVCWLWCGACRSRCVGVSWLHLIS